MSAQDWSRVRKTRKYKGELDAKAVSIAAIISHYGGEVREGRAVAVRCALHSDSRRSAVINTVENLYFCHTCGKGGNAVNIVCILENLEFKDGLKRAVEIAKGVGSEVRSSNKSRGSSRASRTWNI